MTLLTLLIFARMPHYAAAMFWPNESKPMSKSIITPARREGMEIAQACSRDKRRAALLSDLRRSDRAEIVEPDPEHDADSHDSSVSREAVLT